VSWLEKAAISQFGCLVWPGTIVGGFQEPVRVIGNVNLKIPQIVLTILKAAITVHVVVSKKGSITPSAGILCKLSHEALTVLCDASPCTGLFLLCTHDVNAHIR